MRYLLLGGSGFIGNHLATSLTKEHDVTVIGHSSKFHLGEVKYQQLDFISCQDFTEYIKDVDVVVHMISTIIPSDNLSHINQEISDNVFPTTILLNNIAKLGKEIVFLSSGGTIYGENEKPNTEADQTEPICNYGISKLLIEKYIKLYSRLYGINYKIIRLSNPYSEKIYHGKKQGVIPIIIDDIINDKTISVWGNKQVRDYIYIDDVINGINAVLNYSGNEHVFNIGSGTGHTINEIIKLAEKKLGKQAKIKYYPARKCDVNKNILDISLIKQETGWSPKISLPKGIDIVIKNKLDKESNS